MDYLSEVHDPTLEELIWMEDMLNDVSDVTWMSVSRDELQARLRVAQEVFGRAQCARFPFPARVVLGGVTNDSLTHGTWGELFWVWQEYTWWQTFEPDDVQVREIVESDAILQLSIMDRDHEIIRQLRRTVGAEKLSRIVLSMHDDGGIYPESYVQYDWD